MMRKDNFSMAHYESRGKIVGLDKSDYTNWLTGHLSVNDWCRKEYADLPKIFVDKLVYRNNKKFIEM